MSRAARLAQCMLLAALVCVARGRALGAQTISVVGNPAGMTVTDAVPGFEPAPLSASTSYSITTNQPNKIFKVTAQLNTNMPADLTLTATMTVPSGATSTGTQSLSTTPADLITGITRNTTFSGTITYQFVATAAAGVVTAQTRGVTLTIMRTP